MSQVKGTCQYCHQYLEGARHIIMQSGRSFFRCNEHHNTVKYPEPSLNMIQQVSTCLDKGELVASKS